MSRKTRSLHMTTVFLATALAWMVFVLTSAEKTLADLSAIETFIRQAIENNPDLKAQRAKIQAMEQVPSQARALPDPTADIEFMNLSVDEFNASDALGKGVSVGVTQMLPYPGKRGLAERKAQLDVEAEEALLRVMENELRAEVVAVAYRHHLQQRLLEINERIQDTLEAASRSAVEIYASGVGSQADVLLAQTALTRSQTDRRELERQSEIALARLKSLCGGEVDENLLSTLGLPEPSPVCDLDDLLNALPASSPMVLAARAEEAVQDSQVELARKGFRPDFTIGARYRFRDMTMGGGDFVTAMVGMSLPFFHWKDRYRPALQEALSQRERARHAIQSALITSRYNLTEAYQSAIRDLKVYNLYKEGLLIQAREAYQSALASYGVGEVDFASLLMALTNLYTYEGEAFMAQAEFQEAVARMESVVGQRLDCETSASSPCIAPTAREERRP